VLEREQREERARQVAVARSAEADAQKGALERTERMLDAARSETIASLRVAAAAVGLTPPASSFEGRRPSSLAAQAAASGRM
jgi:hypothetical protein